jgi:hypothetical protein
MIIEMFKEKLKENNMSLMDFIENEYKEGEYFDIVGQINRFNSLKPEFEKAIKKYLGLE